MKCRVCVWRRRQFFIREGRRFSERHNLNQHLVVSWPLLDEEDAWFKLTKQYPLLSKAASGKLGKYIRSLGVGRKQTPHIHYLIGEDGAEVVRRVAKIVGPKETIVFPRTPEQITDPEGLLGYFFDNNFLPTFNDPQRPKGIRVISGSRGMSYGFPKLRRVRQ